MQMMVKQNLNIVFSHILTSPPSSIFSSIPSIPSSEELHIYLYLLISLMTLIILVNNLLTLQISLGRRKNLFLVRIPFNNDKTHLLQDSPLLNPPSILFKAEDKLKETIICLERLIIRYT